MTPRNKGKNVSIKLSREKQNYKSAHPRMWRERERGRARERERERE